MIAWKVCLGLPLLLEGFCITVVKRLKFLKISIWVHLHLLLYMTLSVDECLDTEMVVLILTGLTAHLKFWNIISLCRIINESLKYGSKVELTFVITILSAFGRLCISFLLYGHGIITYVDTGLPLFWFYLTFFSFWSKAIKSILNYFLELEFLSLCELVRLWFLKFVCQLGDRTPCWSL